LEATIKKMRGLAQNKVISFIDSERDLADVFMLAVRLAI
jgi:hypothetical protein